MPRLIESFLRPSRLLKCLSATSAIVRVMAQKWPEMGIVVVRAGCPVIEGGSPIMLLHCRVFSQTARDAAALDEVATCEFGTPATIKAISQPIEGGYAIICGPKAHPSMRAFTRTEAKMLRVFSAAHPW